MTALAQEQEYYTYADVLEWDESVRAEIIDGELYMMAEPLTVHQDIHRELFLSIGNFLKGKPCTVYSAPFGVRFYPRLDNSDDTHVEPDITVICDQSRISERGCKGAPDLIIEILSPSTIRLDEKIKFRLYQRAGVREYWIVDPERRLVRVHILTNGSYVTTTYDDTDTIEVSVLPGCVINLKEVFPAVLAPAAPKAPLPPSPGG
jgi:Uma2 family endonuclease